MKLEKQFLLPETSGPPELASLDIEAEKKELQINDEQAHQVLQALWDLMTGFAELGHGADTVKMFFPELFNTVANDNNELKDGRMNE